MQGNYEILSCSIPSLWNGDMQRKERNKLRMREYRKNMSADQKDIVRLNDRIRKRDGRYENLKVKKSSPNYHSVLYRSKKIRKILDNNSDCEVLCHVLKHSLNSPTKRRSIEKRCKEIRTYLSSPENDESVTQQKYLNSLLRKLAVYRSAGKQDKARQIVDIINSKTENIAAVSAQSGHEYHEVYRMMKSPKKRCLPEYTRNFSEVQKQEAIDIYLDPEVSYSLPDTKYAHLRFMSVTIAEAYKNHYLVKSTSSRKMAQSTFSALKPMFIRSIAETPIRGCKCEYCQNFGLLRDTLIASGFKGIPKNHACSIEVTWCPFRKVCDENIHDGAHKCDGFHQSANSDELPQRNCVLRQCTQCGTEKYKRMLRVKNRKLLNSKRYTQWTQWQNKKVFNGKKDVNRMLPTLHTGTLEDIFKEYIKQLKSISRHQFMKIWQLKNFNMALHHLRYGQLLLVHDFSQNLLLFAQDEVPGAHWDHEQATIHPTVAYYIGPCGKLIKEEIIHLTGDRKHDHNAVRTFVKKTIEHLRSKGITIIEIIEWTDHCSNQYKSRKAFFILTVMDMPTTRNFYGVKHGKGPSDRAGAHYKHFVSLAVKSKKALLVTVESLAEYSITEYDHQVVCNGEHKHSTNGEKSPHNLIKVLYTPRGVISRENKYDQTITYKGTRLIHTIRNTGIEGVMEKRDISCCCPHCLYGAGECLYPEYADNWSLISVIGAKALKGLKLSEIQNWRNTITLPVQNVQGNVTNEVPNVYSSSPRSKLKKDTKVRRQLEMGSTMKSSQNAPTSVSNSSNSTGNSFNWYALADKFTNARVWSQAVSIVAANPIPAIQLHRKYKQDRYDVICDTAKDFYPADHPQNFVPIFTVGDGNCFTRAVSHALFGTENKHIETRMRIVYAAVMKEDLFITNSYLCLGMVDRPPERPNLRRPSATINTRYCLYSGDQNVRGVYLSQDEIRNVYRRDVMRISKIGQYTGIWQFPQAVEMSGIPFGSIYPDKGVNERIRYDMNRMFLPNNRAFHDKQPAYIMWSPLHKTSKPSNVKHFVILLQKNRYNVFQNEICNLWLFLNCYRC